MCKWYAVVNVAGVLHIEKVLKFQEHATLGVTVGYCSVFFVYFSLSVIGGFAWLLPFGYVATVSLSSCGY